MGVINEAMVDARNPLASVTDILTDALDRGDYRDSLANCHTPGMDSIVLKNNAATNGGMARIFVTHKGMHRLDQVTDEASGNFILGVHDHRFPLTIVPLLGKFINYEVAIDPNGPEKLHEYEFTSGITSAMGVSHRREVRVQPPHLNEQDPGGLVRMQATDLHTVVIPNQDTRKGLTAWLVLEEPTEKTSHIYSPMGNLSLSSEGLYQPLDPAEAADTIRQVLAEIS